MHRYVCIYVDIICTYTLYITLIIIVIIIVIIIIGTEDEQSLPWSPMLLCALFAQQRGLAISLSLSLSIYIYIYTHTYIHTYICNII